MLIVSIIQWHDQEGMPAFSLIIILFLSRRPWHLWSNEQDRLSYRIFSSVKLSVLKDEAELIRDVRPSGLHLHLGTEAFSRKVASL